MITKIRATDQTKFQARIVIQKKGFENIIKNVGGTSKISARASGSATSGTAEVTTYPARIFSKGDDFSAMRLNADAINKESNAISGRDIRSIKSESSLSNLTDDELADTSVNSSIGSSLVGTGSASSYASGASALEQSANYPNSYYNHSIYENIVNTDSSKTTLIAENAKDLAYNSLYEERFDSLNQLASLSSTTTSGSGIMSNIAGSGKIIEKYEQLNTKNIPS